MRRSITLHLPQPCPESWDQMTPVASGRHCAACQKTVVDFSLMSDAEILAYLARATGSQLCGRFAVGQLERPLRSAAPAQGHWRAWLVAALSLWGLRAVSGSEAQAQVPTEQRAVPNNSPLNHSAKPDSEGTQTTRQIRGQVRSAATGAAVPGAIVSQVGTSVSTMTDADGCFSLPAEGQEITLRILSLPYREEKRTVLAGTPGVVQIEMQAIERLEGLPGRVGGILISTAIKTKPTTPGSGSSLWDWLRRQ